jgi:hypothetical protein
MYFSSKFNPSLKKESRSLDLDRVFSLSKKNEIILPLGSCFLDIFSRELKKNNIQILSDYSKTKIINNSFQFYYGNFFNPLNLLHTLERIVEKKWKFYDNDYVKSKEFNHFINLFIKARYKTNSLDAIKKRVELMDSYLLAEIKKSSVVLLSFESTEIWVDKVRDKAWYSFFGNTASQKCYKNRAKLIVLNYEALKKIMVKIIFLLNKFSKKKIILMVSPHLLWCTYLNKDVQLADSYSKSTFSSVFSDLVSKNVSHFPVLELLNSVNEEKKFRKDYVHVTHDACQKYLIKYFKKIYFK